jgi:flavin-dependent dehydrogenase
MSAIRIAGAGPSGSAAAIAALLEGAAVRISETRRSARHKVCGEFIPAEAAPMLEELGVWEQFRHRSPARISRCCLHSGGRLKQWSLEESGYGLSRLELDRLLLERAVDLGALLKTGDTLRAQEPNDLALILAMGRNKVAQRGRRLVGFKAHFQGPTDDAVELYFSRWGYVGVSPVEHGLTNVCGIASEGVLKKFDFQIDEYLAADPALAARISPLSRTMDWLSVCPVVFSPVPGRAVDGENVYRAGDALGFVDPFTGSGILNALLTGRMAGISAARLIPPDEHVRRCRQRLAQPFVTARVFRAVVDARLTSLAALVPGSWLYRLTRPHVML